MRIVVITIDHLTLKTAEGEINLRLDPALIFLNLQPQRRPELEFIFASFSRSSECGPLDPYFMWRKIDNFNPYIGFRIHKSVLQFGGHDVAIRFTFSLHIFLVLCIFQPSNKFLFHVHSVADLSECTEISLKLTNV